MTQKRTDAASSGTGLTDIWYTRCGAATASAIAIQKGWLQAEFSQGGTALHSLKDSGSQDIRNAHYHHKLSGLFREGGNIPPIWTKARGEDTVVVGITWLDEYQGILTRADGTIRQPADLKWKRLALPLHDNLIDFQRGAALHGFVTTLGLAGISPNEVKFVDVPAGSNDPANKSDSRQRGQPWSSEIAALLAGKVDAIFVRFAAGVSAAKDPRFHQVININEQADPLLRVNNGTPRPVTVDRPFLERHPDLVTRYLAVLLRTAAWAEKHPKQITELLVNEGGGTTAADALASHGPAVHLSFTPSLKPEYIRGLEVQKDFLRDWEIIEADFNVLDWIDFKPLLEARKLVEARPDLLELHPEALVA